MTSEQHALLTELPRACASIRYKNFGSKSVVDAKLEYLDLKVGLSKTSRKVALTPPTDFQYRKYKNRIIVGPDSAGPELKEWSPESFIELAV